MIQVSARHIGLIFRQSAMNAVRGGAGLVFLILVLLFGLMVANLVLSPVERTEAELRRQGAGVDEARELSLKAGTKIVRETLEFVIGMTAAAKPEARSAEPAPSTNAPPPGNPWLKFLMDDRPGLLSAIFVLLLIGVPLISPILGFNQYSSDAQTRGFRYLLLRTERGNIFFGRFLGTVCFGLCGLAFVVAVITGYIWLRIPVYSAGALVVWGLQGFLALGILLIPYVALCSLISAISDSPFLSLSLISAVVGGVPLIALLAGLKWEYAKYVRYLLPWGFQNYLFHPDLVYSLSAAAACLVYAAAYLALGCWRFETRDL